MLRPVPRAYGARALVAALCCLWATAGMAGPCEEHIDSAIKINDDLREAVKASAADPDTRERAEQLLDRALEPLRTACKRGGPWEGEALMRAGGYHGDVRSLLGSGKRPL